MAEIEKQKKRLEGYIENLKMVLTTLKKRIIDPSLVEKVDELTTLAESYLKDSIYYSSKGDFFTSLACVAYGEGLIDAGRKMGLLEFDWPSKTPPPRVLVGGVFDLVHPGHLQFLKEASRYGRVTVIVARDKNAQERKGHPPILGEKSRLEMVRSVKYVHDAHLGEEFVDMGKTIHEYEPDIIFLGPDQRSLEDRIEGIVKKESLKVKLLKLQKGDREYPDLSTSAIIDKVKSLFCNRKTLGKSLLSG